MYTILITSAILVIAFFCLFKKRWDDSNSAYGYDGNYRITLILIFLAVIVLSQTVVSHIRLPYLKQESKMNKVTVIDPIVVKTDSVYLFCDTIKKGNSTTINKTIVKKGKHNFVWLKHTYSLVTIKDNEFSCYDKDEDEYISLSDTKIIVDVKDNNKLSKIYGKYSTEYIPDKWTSQLLPAIDTWTELHISQADYNAIIKMFPNFSKLIKNGK